MEQCRYVECSYIVLWWHDIQYNDIVFHVEHDGIYDGMMDGMIYGLHDMLVDGWLPVIWYETGLKRVSIYPLGYMKSVDMIGFAYDAN